MSTLAEAVRFTAKQFDGAKRRAAALREASKADPKNVQLRTHVANADADAAAIGRDLTEVKFWQALDNWVDRHSRGEIEPDSVIVASAPRVRSFQASKLVPDFTWVGAAMLKRQGVAVPSGWTSPETGEPLPNDSNSDARRAA